MRKIEKFLEDASYIHEFLENAEVSLKGKNFTEYLNNMFDRVFVDEKSRVYTEEGYSVEVQVTKGEVSAWVLCEVEVGRDGNPHTLKVESWGAAEARDKLTSLSFWGEDIDALIKELRRHLEEVELEEEV